MCRCMSPHFQNFLVQILNVKLHRQDFAQGGDMIHVHCYLKQCGCVSLTCARTMVNYLGMHHCHARLIPDGKEDGPN